MATQDLTTYIESESENKLSETASKITVTDIRRYSNSHLYKDFGADYFNKIDVDLTVYAHDGSAGGAFGWGFSNEETYFDNDSGGWSGNWIAGYIYRGGSGTGRIYVGRQGPVWDYYLMPSFSVVQYLTIQRAQGSDDVYTYIYSDEARTSLLDTITVSGVGTSSRYQYFFACTSIQVDSNTEALYGYIENIDLKTIPQPTILSMKLIPLTSFSIGLYDTRYKLRARQRDTALTTRVRNT
jgi:hypothetical protein